MDENKDVNSTDPKREKVRVIPLSAIDDAPDHLFGVRDDEEMAELVESISTFGVINPVIVRKGEGERYELISGHRRKYACAKLGIDTLPVIVRDLSREEAIIFMVDSNLQREHILPSERAKAYKMKLDALKKQGERTDLTSRPMVGKFETADIIGGESGDSGRQVQSGVLTEERIEAILSEEKPNQKPKIKVPMERIQKYFSPDASVQEIEDTIVKALSAYRRSQELQMAKANRTIKEAR